MGYVVSQLQAVLSLEDRGFSQGMKNAQQETKKTAKDAEDAGKRIEKVGSSLSRIGSSLSLAVTVPLVALGKQAIKSATELDSLKMGLRAVEGSSTAAEKSLKRLEQTAKLPGLGFKEAVRGYINLRAAGQAADLATRSLEAFGNALATVGKGKSELDGVVLALGQMEAKGKVSAEEINQIAERVPQIRKIMLEAFGTADTELIQKAGITSRQFVEAIVTELEKLPKVTGGIKNDFENAMDSIDRSLSRLGATLAPKAAAGLNFIADKVDKLSTSWDKLPKGQQDLITYLGLGALAAGPATMLLGNLAQLAVNLGQLGVSLGTVGRLGVAAVPVLAAVMAFKPHWEMSKETVQLEKQAKQGDAYVESSKLGQSIRLGTETRTLQEYLGFLKKGQGAFEFLKTKRGTGFDDVSNLLDRELGKDRRDDSADSVAKAIARLQAQQKQAKAAFDNQRAQVYKDTIKSIFSDLTNPKLGSTKLSAADLTAKKKAEEEARREAERKRKEAERERQRHAENFARNTQSGRDELDLLNAPDEFARMRREASQKRRDDLKSMDKKIAQQLYDVEMKRIDKLQAEAQKQAMEDAMRGMARTMESDLDRLGKESTEALRREQEAKRKSEAAAKVRESVAAIGERIVANGLPFGYDLDPRRLDGTRLSSIEDLRARARGTVEQAGGTGAPVGYAIDAAEYARRVRRHAWAGRNARHIASDIAGASGGFGYDLLSGSSAKEAGRRMKDSLVEALNQGAAKEIERVVARSITDPIAKAIERGLDPLAEKLAHSLEVSTKGLRMSTQQIISSAYSLLAMSQRKKKFGLGTLLGIGAGIATGGSLSTVLALGNIGNAVDNNDYEGALYGGLNVFAQGSWGNESGGGNPAPGNAPADGRAVVIHASGWTVNSQADENRLINNMAQRVRVASVVGG